MTQTNEPPGKPGRFTRSYVAHVAPTINRLLCEIESALRQTWQLEIQGQNERCIGHKQGDFLWREKVGWAVCLAETPAGAASIKVRLRGVEKEVMAGYYVNVADVCLRNSALLDLVEQLRHVISCNLAFAPPDER